MKANLDKGHTIFKPSKNDSYLKPVKSANSFNKLAQLVTKQEKLNKRAKKKAYSNAIAMQLMTYVNNQEWDKPLRYHTTYFCSSEIEQIGDKLTTYYCRQRWCPICSGIRTAKLMKQYEKPISEMTNPLFLTLTTKSVCADELEPRFNAMKKAIVRIKRNLLKTYNIRLIGLRKTESQYKYIGNGEFTYNPHFHFILDMLPCQAMLMTALWLNQWTLEEANPDAQNTRPADTKSLKELFKYEVKPLTTNKKGQFSPSALNVIFEALYKKRAIQAYGMKQNDVEEENDDSLQAIDFRTKKEKWQFRTLNYYNDIEESLTTYEPTDKDKKFFKLTRYNHASK